MALTFNGSTGYLLWDKGGGSMPVTAYPYSMVCWMSVSGGSGDRHAVMIQSSASTYFTSLGIPGNARAVTYDGSNFQPPEWTGSPTPDTTLRLAVGIFTSVSDGRFYWVDSSRADQDTTTVTDRISTYDRITVGARYAGGSLMQYLPGDVAEVHFFDSSAMTYTDATSRNSFVDSIAALAGGSTGPESITGWVDGWSLSDTSSLTSIGGTRTLTLTGGVTTSAATHPITGRGAGPSFKAAWLPRNQSSIGSR